MLHDAEEKDFTHVISWNSDGASSRVHEPMVFTEKIIPTYFNQTKYKSFQRQLNFYGFVRIHQGYHKASYGNKNFRRDDLSNYLIPRPKVTRSHAKCTPSNSFSRMSTIDLQAILDSEAEPISLVWDKAGSTNATFLEPTFTNDEVCCLSAEVQLFVKDLFKTDATDIDAGDVLNDFSNDPLFQSMMNDPILLSLERNKSDLVIGHHAPEE